MFFSRVHFDFPRSTRGVVKISAFGMTHRDEFGHLKGGSIVFGAIVLVLVSSVGFGTEILDTLDWRSLGLSLIHI